MPPQLNDANNKSLKEIIISMKITRAMAPGRICLFGEHQDFLGLPVIACAIDLRIAIEGRLRPDRRFVLRMPDIDDEDSFDVDDELPYRGARDYVRSTVNVLLREGWRSTAATTAS